MENKIELVRAAPSHRTEIFSISEKIWEGQDYIPNLWDNWIKEKGFYVINYSGKVVGCIKTTWNSENDATMEGLRISENYTGKGIAGAAFGKMLSRILEKEPKCIRFATSNENKVSHHLGEKHGFVKKCSFYHRFLNMQHLNMEDVEKKEMKTNDMKTKDDASNEFQIRKPNREDADEIMGFIRQSPEWKASNGLISQGWVFLPLSMEILQKEISLGFSLTAKRNEILSGVLLASVSEQRPDNINISWLNGEENSVEKLIMIFLGNLSGTGIKEVHMKIPTKALCETAERVGFIKHKRVDSAFVFERCR